MRHYCNDFLFQYREESGSKIERFIYYMNSYNKMEIQPRLKTIAMVRETMKEKNGQCSRYQLWKLLPRKTMYQAYTAALTHLEQNNEIATNHHKKLVYFEKRKKQRAITREMILDNLARYGYDLITLKTGGKIKKIPLDDLLVEI